MKEHVNTAREMQAEPLSLAHRQAFFQQMGLLFSSGCSLADSLLALGQTDKESDLSRTAASILRRLEHGSRLSDAMAGEQGVFSREEVSLVRLGEETGRLHAILHRIGENLETSLDNRRRFVQASVYPVTVFLFSILLVSFMALVLLPKLSPVFQGFQLALPWPTRAVLAFAQVWPWFVFFALVLGFGGALLIHQSKNWKKLLFSLPFVRSILKARSLGETSASLAILVASGARLDLSFLLLAQQSEDPALAQALQRLRLAIREGESLPQALRDEPDLPRLWKQLFIVGCETGRIDYFCERLAEIYLEDFRWKLGQTIALLEPLLLMGVGGVVGFLLLACFLPFYTLVTVAL